MSRSQKPGDRIHPRVMQDAAGGRCADNSSSVTRDSPYCGPFFPPRETQNPSPENAHGLVLHPSVVPPSVSHTQSERRTKIAPSDTMSVLNKPTKQNSKRQKGKECPERRDLDSLHHSSLDLQAARRRRRRRPHLAIPLWDPRQPTHGRDTSRLLPNL